MHQNTFWEILKHKGKKFFKKLVLLSLYLHSATYTKEIILPHLYSYTYTGGISPQPVMTFGMYSLWHVQISS